jgi:hypothetical protein
MTRHNVSWMKQTDGYFNESYILGDKIRMLDFQKYRAIIDVDGNSWSSRFAKLLCYASVVLKVQPNSVDYFYPQLQPWVHYIPVHSDLSNLYEMTLYAISDDPSIDRIIQNANQWCMEHLNRRSLIQDTAHILNRYAYHLLVQPNPTTTTTMSPPDVNEFRKYSLPPDRHLLHTLSLNYNSLWQPEQQRLLLDYNFTPVYPKRRKYDKIATSMLWHSGICLEWIILDIIAIVVIVVYHIYKRRRACGTCRR